MGTGVSPFEWNACYFIDCIDGMKQLPDQCVDLCITDPPYNITIGSTMKRVQAMKEKRIHEIYYDDSMTRDDYETWCRAWFAEVKRVSKMILITPGKPNEAMWDRIEEPVDRIYNFKPNSRSPGHLVMSVTIDVMLAYGTWKPLQCFPYDVYFQNVERFEGIIHPCPKNYKFWLRVVRDSRWKIDVKTIMDPFLGSGTTAQVASHLGLKWIGFEINKQYENDIRKRIALGIQASSDELKKKSTIDDFVEGT